MTAHKIVALLCPSCGGEGSQPRERPFGAEFRCEHCSVTSVLIIDQALMPLSTLQTQGEKVCIVCGRIAAREARFCQEGHALVRECIYLNCTREFAVDHQRCDFCGKIQDVPPLKLHQVYQGTVRDVSFNDAVVDIGITRVVLNNEFFANHQVWDFRDELKVGDTISVKVARINKDDGILVCGEEFEIPEDWLKT